MTSTSRPLILIGAGCKRNPELIKYLCSLGIPVCTTWMAMDTVPENSSVFVGRPGIYGQRAANIIIQKATELVCFGTRLDGEQVAYNYDSFAPNSEKYIYDVDESELNKLNGWNKRVVDLSTFVMETNEECVSNPEWLKWCKDLYNQFRPELDGVERTDGFVDPMWFISRLSDKCTSDYVLAIGSSGGAALSFVQGFKIKEGQILTNCSTIGAMGMDIPMAIGACLASGKKRTICVTGDGGFMLNIQELEVVKRLMLPIKFFVYDNNGYGSIRNMQDARFEGRHVGCDRKSGFTLPDLEQVVESYGICFNESDKWETHFDLSIPMVFRLKIDPNYKQSPRVLSSLDKEGKWHQDSFEDMTPKLPPEQLREIMEY